MVGEQLVFFKPSEGIKELRLLEELERNPMISQRQLSQKSKTALGVTNACLRRMIQKGWIQIRELNHQRIGYYITPKGLMEKIRLSYHMIAYSVQYYSELKNIIAQRFLEMEEKGFHRIVFYGLSDETEVAYIVLQGINLKLVGIVEDEEKLRPQIFLGYEVEPVTRINELKPHCVFVTSLEKSEEKKERIRKLITDPGVYVCDLCAR